jgi:hypothetical protein
MTPSVISRALWQNESKKPLTGREPPMHAMVA